LPGPLSDLFEKLLPNLWNATGPSEEDLSTLRAASSDIDRTPIIESAVPTPRNLAGFTAKMAENIGKTKSPEFNKMLGYVRTRYPNLMKKVKQVAYYADDSFPKEFLNAGYNPGTKLLEVFDVPGRYGAKDYVNALGHELSHAAQGRRVDPFNFFREYDLMSNRVGYRNNPFEVAARKGGETATKAYERFLDLLGK
jgi:hypothetical protein